jgi:HD-like signal output (HDOD) protein
VTTETFAPRSTCPSQLDSLESELTECWDAIFQEIDSGELELPLMPRNAQEVICLANDQNADLADLAAVIQRDQDLAGQVLRFANSATFDSGQTVSSLQQAASRLGVEFIANAALAITLKSDFFRIPELETVATDIWKHALASAFYGREIACVKRCNVECQYLCGLLHTIGKPVGLKLLSSMKKRGQITLPTDDLVRLSEAAHSQIGTRLAQNWGLPKQVIYVCQWYQSPGLAEEFQDETAMTYLSDLLARQVLNPDRVDEEALQADGVFEQLNLCPDEVAELFERGAEVGTMVNSMNP